MIEKEIQFELISPEEKLVSESVYLAEIPGDKGMFGVLPGHSSMLMSLGTGVVRLHKNQNNDEGDVRKIFIAGGFADVTAKSCTVLAEEAVAVEDLDQTGLEHRLSDLQEDLKLAEEMADKQRIRADIAMTKSKLFAITGY